MVLRRALLICLSVISMAGVVMAQTPDPDLPPPDPPGTWRRITMQEETTTSRCVGNPVTPLCAIETFFGCIMQRRQELCDMVDSGMTLYPGPPDEADRRREYRIMYSRRPSRLDPVDPVTEGPLKPQPGDVMIALMIRICYGPLDQGRCHIGVEDDPLHIYVMRKRDNLWTNPYYYRPRF